MTNGAIRGRFAPSPTGEIHLGNAWTALLAWLQVRAAGGTMVLRIEDLDPDRSRPAYSEALIAEMKWLGLDWDEGPDSGGKYAPYCQDERRGLYQAALERLDAAGLVYPCYCTRTELAASAPHAGEQERVYPGICRQRTIDPARRAKRRPALRLAVPPGEISFTDLHAGWISQDISREVGDFVVRRSDGVHAYQLAVVVDDAAMQITHVLRGDDLLRSTPRQLLLYRLLGLKAPVFTHVPLLIDNQGYRLSKRQQALSIAALRSQGVKPEAIIGYLAWKAGLLDQYQPVKAAELVGSFALARMPSGPVVVDCPLPV
ncbi:tRNA glutamyl-Q(34) synthetase GluQRS [Sporomusa acidovorans]|uniref:Glutamyl-Q tRNA(Asp) synthetase n=1 Tax=Sporomusa acidovorans (strain ATCC 49682 / DSM 3132 / Mol) TaxID=1123286 RepID=A0ABZ3J8B1_SPOA4|nr:tRNA glutamyl-Q(34) synthetase GluQRS [Sporomusa acidovorans]OZC21252.1 glutamate--tRNA ligase 1 [Sporomusa acidovorans DSM 3132]SDE65988.1 glutamyl-tRNA synthetase [Sporomusa acidovorans]